MKPVIMNLFGKNTQCEKLSYVLDICDSFIFVSDTIFV